MHPLFADRTVTGAIPIWPLAKADCESWLARQPASMARWAKTNKFDGSEGQVLKFPDSDGGIAGIGFGLGDNDNPLVWRALPSAVPPQACYRIDAALAPAQAALAALAWLLGSYSFTRYKSASEGADDKPRLVVPEGVDAADAGRIAEGVCLARDLINIPACDLGPEELAQAAHALAERYGADFNEIVGDALLDKNYPMIHAVGKGSVRPPRLIDFTWGEPDAPKLTLVGKGIVFDSGGLDLKPSSAMLLMKKDMGGAANVLGLAQMIMDAALPVRLRVLVPTAENAISGSAFRPGDVLQSRKGISVEIGNTDAEGRLVLADALTEADSEKPDMLIDLATLTGAARVALGAEIPPFFTDDAALAEDLYQHAENVSDPLWRLPLWKPYAKGLESKIATVNNVTDGGMAGAITAALFLRKFVTDTTGWVHCDIYGWNAAAGPGRPVGGEGQAIRALYSLICARYLPR